jgi:hypothetical protein
MSRTYAEKINIGDKKNPVHIDLYNDSQVGQVVSYALRSIKTLGALKQLPEINVGKGIEAYSTRFPHFDERTGMHGALISPSPHDDETYWVIMDERLNDSQMLGQAFHEMSHLVGGYHEDEKQAQKTTLAAMQTIASNYEELDSPDVTRVLQRDAGINYKPSEVSKEKLGRALQYVADTSRYFDVSDHEVREQGVHRVSPKPKRTWGRRQNSGLERRLAGLFFVFLGMILTLGNVRVTGAVVGAGSFFGWIGMIGLLSFLIGGIMVLMGGRPRSYGTKQLEDLAKSYKLDEKYALGQASNLLLRAGTNRMKELSSRLNTNLTYDEKLSFEENQKKLLDYFNSDNSSPGLRINDDIREGYRKYLGMKPFEFYGSESLDPLIRRKIFKNTKKRYLNTREFRKFKKYALKEIPLLDRNLAEGKLLPIWQEDQGPSKHYPGSKSRVIYFGPKSFKGYIRKHRSEEDDLNDPEIGNSIFKYHFIFDPKNMASREIPHGHWELDYIGKKFLKS